MSGECDKCGEHALECECNEMLDFITRAHQIMEQERIDAHQRQLDKIRRWNDENREFLRECIRNYEKTEKGAYAVSKRNSRRTAKMKELHDDLSWEEKISIGDFYRNCPEGYEVDHIIPVSRGGEHKLSNLQYLTKEENRKKGAKLDWKNPA